MTRVAWFDRTAESDKRARRPRPPAKPKQGEMAGMETCDAAVLLTKVKRESDAKESAKKKAENDLDFDFRRFKLPPFVRQFVILKSHQTPRKDLKPIPKVWRYDFCFHDFKLIVEVDGGIWMPEGGAHSHPVDIERNLLKRNDAVLAGFDVIAFTPKQISAQKSSGIHSARTRETRMEAMSEPRKVWYNGQKVRLRELATLTGHNVHTLVERYEKGDREPTLWRALDKPGPRASKEPRDAREAARIEQLRIRREQRERAIARMRAEHAAAFSRPFIAANLLTPAERAAITKRIRYARQPSEVSALEAAG